jgi:hypothetical protein
MWQSTSVVIWFMCSRALSVYYAAVVGGLSVTPVLIPSNTSVCNYLKLLDNVPRGLNVWNINYILQGGSL